MRTYQDEFNLATQRKALDRQGNLCASCGTPITTLGEGGRGNHEYGEIVHAHHRIPVKASGRNTLANCVILCQSCHYSAHEGGNYRYGKVVGRKRDFPHYYYIAVKK
jgi:5-methylcytosine-specific restriction endonuclease McrA